MMGYLKKISGEIPNTLQNVDIKLDGKNLIITGGNGSGKTSLITGINEKINILIKEKKLADLEKNKRQLERLEKALLVSVKGTSQHVNQENAIKSLKAQIEIVQEGLQLDIPNYLEFSIEFDAKKSIIRFFEAQRNSKIQPSEGATALDNKTLQQAENAGIKFEQHLVNLRTRSSFAITEDKNNALHKKITTWFSEFDNNLKYLMEDDSTKLIFKPNEFKFYIGQNNKKPYTFQSLSSGYSAIFDILADLIIRTEFFGVSPSEITGIALIDEIDAHLHVSLQRKILPFLIKSFPKLQFIVTTHSPFVITSVSDTVIYDIKTQEQVSDDLSMYSYDAIVEGLLGVPPISKEMEDEMNKLADLIIQGAKSKVEVQTIVNKLHPHEDNLDAQSQMIYQRAVYFLLQQKNQQGV